MKRSKLKSKGKRAEREAEALALFREAVLARGACERCGSPRMLTSHHRLKRSQGGSHDPEENGICCCMKCHRLIEDHACEDWRDWVTLQGSNR